jgi:hypothetical protein
VDRASGDETMFHQMTDFMLCKIGETFRQACDTKIHNEIGECLHMILCTAGV